MHFQQACSILDKRREARKRKKQREKDAERGEGCADADEMAADDQLLAQVYQCINQFNILAISFVNRVLSIVVLNIYFYYLGGDQEARATKGV